MPYADIFLVYDLLGAAIARGELDISHYVKNGDYTRTEILSCLCMLWRERLIMPPVVSFVDGQDSVISFGHGANDCGRGMHRLLRETLLTTPDFHGMVIRAGGGAATSTRSPRQKMHGDMGGIRVVR
ncbi:hypothetical protein [Dyella sp. 2RAB6]|uniref:hypothetical protein n=1 Tax=Dyella sp. 2RAB6 TaxID=3232992 RepID=UPI003F925C2F